MRPGIFPAIIGKKTSRFVPLNATSLSEALDDYRRLRVERDEDRLRPIGRVPTLTEYVDQSYADALRNSGKRDASVRKELGYLRLWCRQLGHLRLNRIRPFHLGTVLTDLA
ncbi:MAG: hypothetical protein HS113_15380 [Verrucomicrobiales bacterium]|nr:hypothetical protein [Verrucomicrobiales bacterium]